MSRSFLVIALILMGFGASVLSKSEDEESTRVAGLLKALDDPNPDVRESAASALAKFGRKAKTAIPILKKTRTANLTGEAQESTNFYRKRSHLLAIFATK